MSNKKVIGLGGVARAGKDTFAAILEMKLQQAGKTVKKIALAGPLKKDCDEFLKSNLGISAFTQDPSEKILIRPFLVWYGDAQRKRTNGRYWVELASKAINETESDYYIITDVRYNVYDKDEMYWLKNEWNGTLCHVRKYNTLYDFGSNSYVRDYVNPANQHEEENDPRIRAGSQFKVEWPHVSNVKPEDLLFNPELNEYVEKFMVECKILN